MAVVVNPGLDRSGMKFVLTIRMVKFGNVLCRMPFLTQPSFFIRAWDWHRSHWTVTPMARFGVGVEICECELRMKILLIFTLCLISDGGASSGVTGYSGGGVLIKCKYEFWVMIKELTVQDTGTYQCGVDIKFGPDIYTPVDLNIKKGFPASTVITVTVILLLLLIGIIILIVIVQKKCKMQ
ncbi:hypothetical protein QTP70_009079, partial [Hemibagrus guttatus]